ncbi:hypothetical protein GGR54DRAFT_584323 [Hypoxylon sp. NC1633]|nr:hypothetical protein GGR54DRAFT_584323 [Hypoxylon sp. NC1633]
MSKVVWTLASYPLVCLCQSPVALFSLYHWRRSCHRHTRINHTAYAHRPPQQPNLSPSCFMPAVRGHENLRRAPERKLVRSAKRRACYARKVISET